MRRVVAVVRMKESVLLLLFSLAMAVVLAGGVALLGAARPAGAAPAAEEGKILFFSFSSTPEDDVVREVRELQTINPDGSGRFSFSPPIEMGSYSEWSDDGTKFVYVDWTDQLSASGPGDIVFSSADGTEISRVHLSRDLYPNLGFVRYTTLSPDGTKVAFAVDDYTYISTSYGDLGVNSSDIYTMNVNGSNLTRLDSDVPREVLFTDLDWSPDGNKIALTHWDAYVDPGCVPEPGCVATIVQLPQVDTMNADGTGQSTGFAAPVDGWQPAWSPDGSKIAYLGNDWDLHIMSADGTDQSSVTTDGYFGLHEYDPAWSPKGTRLVFSGYGYYSGIRDLYTIDVDGSNRTDITNTTDEYEATPSWQPVFPPSDTTAPKVSETYPSNNATGVAATADITATFLEEGSGIAPNTLTYSTFKVVQVKPAGNVAVSGDVRYNETSKKATFDPTSSLAKGLYKATITTGVKDKAGNALSKDHTWQFTTAGPSKK